MVIVMSDYYIKRDDALKAVDSFIGTDPIANRIKLIPSADVAPVRHGRWYKNDQDKLLMRTRCSICNKAIYSENYFAYCPNCGARMDGEDDETDRR